MEARIARLESDVEYIKRDIGEIKGILVRIEGKFDRFGERIDGLKDKIHANTLWMIGVSVGLIGLAIAIAKTLFSHSQ